MRKEYTRVLSTIALSIMVTFACFAPVSAQNLKSRPQGNGVIKLNGAFDIPASMTPKIAGSSPVSAVLADLNEDGIDDLIIGHQDSVSIQRGDMNAFAPRTREAWEAIRDLRYLSPFEKETNILSLQVRPDFLQAGDFTRDGHVDLIAASRETNLILLLEGDGKGNFGEPREIYAVSNITALTTGDVNRANGLPDVIVGTGSEVSIYQGLGDIFDIDPQRVSLSSIAETIAVGQFDNNTFADIAIGNGNIISLISGSDSVNTVIDLPQDYTVRSLIAGDFVPDRALRTELAALDADGIVHIITRGDLDTRPVLPNEHLAAEVLKMQAKNWLVSKQILAKLSGADFRNPESVIETRSQAWAEYDQFDGAIPGNAVSANAVLTSGRLSNYGDDLILLDSSNNRIIVMPLVFDPASKEKISYAGRRETVAFDLDNSPVAAIPARLNFDGRNDLLILQNGRSEASTLVTSPQASFTVNNAGDAPDASPGNGVCATAGAVCTLRAAIMEANRLAGNDSISINSGLTITLSNGKADNDGFGDNSASSGDLDIFCAVDAFESCATPLSSNVNDLSITGAAGGNIVQSGTFSPSNSTGATSDRVFDIGMDGIFGGGFGGSVALNITMSNLTIQNGNVREDFNVGFGTANYARGGAIRMDGFGQSGTRGSLTMTSVTINNNQADHETGGVFDQYASISWTSVTATTNIGKAGPGGALQFLAGSPATMSVSSSTFSANESRIGTVFGAAATDVDGGAIAANHDANTGLITNTNFNNNISQDDGGALKAFNGAITVTGGTMSGNTARDDGGAIWTDNDTVSGTRFLTLSGVTIRGNTANSDTSGGGDGGGVFRDRGTLNVTNCTIGGTAGGQPNTANNGGGIAHAFRVFPSASNVATINIDNGSITGNNARKTLTTGEGGGVFFNGANAASPSVLNVGAVTLVTIDENNSNDNGGGISLSGGSTGNITRAVISGNDADADTDGDGNGGGIFLNNAGGNTTVASTITLMNNGNGTNTTENGGAIFQSNGNLTLNSPPLTGNNAGAHGGGLFVAGGIANVNSVTFSANTSTSGTEVRLTGGTTNVTGTNTIPGELSVAGGTLAAGSSIVNLGEDFHFSSGIFTSGTSTFNFNGSGAQQIYGGSTPTFRNVSDANTLAPLAVNNNASFDGNLIVNANAVVNPAASVIIGGSGTLTGNGTVRVTRTAATPDFLSQYTIANRVLSGLTVNYFANATQTINALSYGNLATSTGGIKTLAGSTSASNATVGANSTLTVGGSQTFTVAGVLTNSGIINGLGTIANNFSNGGVLAPGLSPGILNITGNFANTGSFNVEIGGTGGAGVNPSGHDQLLVSGTAAIGGTLNVTLTNGFTPSPGNSFLIIDAATSSGNFTTANLPNIFPNGWQLLRNDAAGTYILNIVGPTAASVSISGRVMSQNGVGIPNSRITFTNSTGASQIVASNSFGHYRISNINAGDNYTVSVYAKGHYFVPRLVEVFDEITGLNLVSEP